MPACPPIYVDSILQKTEVEVKEVEREAEKVGRREEEGSEAAGTQQGRSREAAERDSREAAGTQPG